MMDDQGAVKRHDGERWWQDWRWIAAIAFLLFALAFVAFTVSTVTTGNVAEDTEAEVQDLTGILDQLAVLAANNAEELEEIRRTQSGVEELVTFVRDIQAQPDSDVNEQLFIDLLCSSTDPARIAACAELTGEGP